MIAATVVIQIALPGGTRKNTFTKNKVYFCFVVYLYDIMINVFNIEAPQLKKIPKISSFF